LTEKERPNAGRPEGEEAAAFVEATAGREDGRQNKMKPWNDGIEISAGRLEGWDARKLGRREAGRLVSLLRICIGFK
jgi:hypothetical protein